MNVNDHIHELPNLNKRNINFIHIYNIPLYTSVFIINFNIHDCIDRQNTLKFQTC